MYHLSFTYLGITITKPPTHLYKQNIVPYIAALENTLTGWQNLPRSYVGRAHLLKMSSRDSFLSFTLSPLIS